MTVTKEGRGKRSHIQALTKKKSFDAPHWLFGSSAQSLCLATQLARGHSAPLLIHYHKCVINLSSAFAVFIPSMLLFPLTDIYDRRIRKRRLICQQGSDIIASLPKTESNRGVRVLISLELFENKASHVEHITWGGATLTSDN